MADPVCTVCGCPWYKITSELFQYDVTSGKSKKSLQEILLEYNIDPAIDNCCLLKLKAYISGEYLIHQKHNSNINYYVQ